MLSTTPALVSRLRAWELAVERRDRHDGHLSDAALEVHEAAREDKHDISALAYLHSALNMIGDREHASVVGDRTEGWPDVP